MIQYILIYLVVSVVSLIQDNVYQLPNDPTKYLIMTTSNYGMMEMTLNWAASLRRQGYSRFVIACLDEHIYNELHEHGLGHHTAWFVQPDMSPHAEWGTDLYMRLMFSRVKILRQLLHLHYTVLFTDVDVVFLSKHVLEHIVFETHRHQPDITFMVDNAIGTPRVINGGFLFLRPTPRMDHILDRVMYWMKSGDKDLAYDQMALNHVVDKELKIKYSQHVHPLDMSLYASGWTYKRNRMNERLGIQPMVVHFNWIAHTKNKIKYMKEQGMFYL